MSAALALIAPSAAPVIDGEPVTDERELLGIWVRSFEEAETASRDARELANKCRDYYDGRQFTPEEMAEFERRRQPPTVNNKIKPKVQTLLGLERKGRSDPKAFPRTPVEDSRADAATQALRFIVDENRYDVIRSSVYENLLIEGVGGCEVIAEPNELDGGYNVVINHVPYNRLFWDPHSSHPGFSDAQYIGCVVWMDLDEGIRMYPGCESVLEDTLGAGGRFDQFDDRPQVVWSDAKRKRVRVVQMHMKRGRAWWTGTFTKSGFVEGPSPSPYLDRHGDPTCPLILRSCYCDRDNNRYGVVRDMIPLQDAINKRESKLLHSLNVNQIILENGSVDDVDQARIEAAKPDGVIVRNKGFEFEVRKDTAEIQGHFQLLQWTNAQLNGMGPNANMMGKDPRDQSGRAILAQQSGGVIENEPVADTLRQHTHKAMEAAWMRVRQFWQSEKWVRVTDNDKNIKFVGLNRRITLGDMMQALDRSAPVQSQIAGLPPDEQRAVMFGLNLAPNDPRMQMTVKIVNDIGDMDVDITVEEGPDNPTIRHEAWQLFVQLPQQALMNLPPEAFIMMNPGFSGDDKTKLLDMMKEHQAGQAKQVERQQAAQEAMQQATIDDKQAQAADKKASAMTKLHDIAYDHAEAQHVPLVPGVGPIQPEVNPLLQPQSVGPEPAAV